MQTRKRGEMDHLRLTYRSDLVTLVSRSCCGIDAPARGTGHSRWLQATFISLLVFFSCKRDGFSHMHGFLSQRGHKPGVFLPPAPTRAPQLLLRSGFTGGGVQLLVFPSRLPPSPSPDTWACLLPLSFPVCRVTGTGKCCKSTSAACSLKHKPCADQTFGTLLLSPQINPLYVFIYVL